jgi:hypothetical protein
MRKWILFGAGLSVMCLASLGNAQTPTSDLYSYASYANRVETLERELAQVHAQLASYGTGGDKHAKSYDDKCCGESNWFVGGEVAVLKPFIGLPASEAFDYEATPRIWLGYEHGSGLGTRATYWQFDNSNPTERLTWSSIRSTWMLPSGDNSAIGTSWCSAVCATARIGIETNEDRQAEEEYGITFEGLGPTLGAEVRRPIGSRGWALVGNVRGSLLFDDRLSIRGDFGRRTDRRRLGNRMADSVGSRVEPMHLRIEPSGRACSLRSSGLENGRGIRRRTRYLRWPHLYGWDRSVISIVPLSIC